jgi:chemotaxis protein MotB
MFVGCVSTGKYKKLESDSKAQQQALTAEKQALEAQLAGLQSANSTLAQQAEELKRSSEQTQNQYASVLEQLKQEVQDGNLKVTQYQNMLTVDVAEKLFFDSGSATLKKSGQQVLSKVSGAIAKYTDKVVRVVGHTDNVPLSKKYQSIFPSNWELSVLRATNVVRFLQDKGEIKPENLIASGRGEYEPIAPNDTPEGRQKNRRIEIMLIDKNVAGALKAPQQ